MRNVTLAVFPLFFGILPFIEGHPLSNNPISFGLSAASVGGGVVYHLKVRKTLLKSAIAYNKAIVSQDLGEIMPQATENLMILEKLDLIVSDRNGAVHKQEITGFKVGEKGSVNSMGTTMFESMFAKHAKLKPHFTKYAASEKSYKKLRRNKTLKQVGLGLAVVGVASAFIGKEPLVYGTFGIPTGLALLAVTPIEKHVLNGVYQYNQGVLGNDISYISPFKYNRLDKFKPSFYGIGYNNYNSVMGTSVVPTLKLAWHL